ncbi:MAG: flagellar export chaperone FliS [Calditrichaeota bacterium]|nr:flagellar export chaperone FliS [Candidatus Cloacimonadota bacterium]MCA9786993.1 flagellar export chaperone FliS [Candidatus Cloacimonadota bacterium]MCB1047052.1 flagellar export chaperone FliS [Calditrichota bacterium]MCB9475092.1 flagellar export chaperone FliS [Candidatus Delongbacteria bacterium]
MATDTRARQYNHTSVHTADRGKLLLMVYDVAIGSLLDAQKSMNDKDFQQKGQHMDRALRAIAELRKSLDMEKGQEIARSLERLYEFMMHRMTEANFNNQADHLDVVVNILQDLRETWGQVVQQHASESPEQTAVAAPRAGFLA